MLLVRRKTFLDQTELLIEADCGSSKSSNSWKKKKAVDLHRRRIFNHKLKIRAPPRSRPTTPEEDALCKRSAGLSEGTEKQRAMLIAQ